MRAATTMTLGEDTFRQPGENILPERRRFHRADERQSEQSAEATTGWGLRPVARRPLIPPTNGGHRNYAVLITDDCRAPIDLHPLVTDEFFPSPFYRSPLSPSSRELLLFNWDSSEIETSGSMTTAHGHPIKHPAGNLHISRAGLGFIFRHEALAGVSNHLHWPGGSSGVTLGPGYDMKARDKHTIVRDMLRIGVSKAIAGKISDGSKLVGPKAEDFADDNEDLVSLTSIQETALLGVVVPHYESIVRRNVHVHLLHHEFDALVSFVYNPGGSFLPVSQALNNGKVSDAMRIIKGRIVTGGHKSHGLLFRRVHEIQLFQHGAYHSHHAPHSPA
jgi:hypothetical protein